MPSVTVGKENSAPVDIYYEDHGSGSAVVLIYGFPLSGGHGSGKNGALVKAGLSRDHLRPARIRQVQPALVRL